MNRIYLFFFFILFFCESKAQNENDPKYLNEDYTKIYKNTYYYNGYNSAGYQQIYWNDIRNQKMVKCNFTFVGDEPFQDQYFIIQKEMNGPMGLVDLKTNTIVVPFENDNIYFDGFFIVLRDSQYQYIILNKDLKMIYISKEDNFKVNGSFVFVQNEYTDKSPFADYVMLAYTSDILNEQGVKLNPEPYSILDDDFFGIDNLLLVQNKAGKKLYMDTKGNLKIDVSKYSKASRFSNGLAAVENRQKKWGYINATGEVIIPFMYNDAELFSATTALVSLKNGSFSLIDRNNTQIKIFSEIILGRDKIKDSKILYYIDAKGVKYDSNGDVK